MRGQVVPGRFAPPFDRDYYVAILQIRRYLYGGLNEARLRRFISGMVPRIRFKGLLSACPLVDDVALMKSLDGWMLHSVEKALSRRAQMLRAAGYAALPFPHGLPKRHLASFRSRSTSGAPLDLRLPSFVRMSSVLLKASHVHGTSAVVHRHLSGYSY